MRRFISGFEVLHSSREYKGSWGVRVELIQNRPALLGTVLCSRELWHCSAAWLEDRDCCRTLFLPGSGLSDMISFSSFAFYLLSKGICSLASLLFPNLQSIPKVPSFQGCLPGLEESWWIPGSHYDWAWNPLPRASPISLPNSTFSKPVLPLILHTSCSLFSIALTSGFWGL